MLLGKKQLTPAEGQKSDPAHPAIYPTGQAPSSLGIREAKIYNLVVHRFLAVFGEAPGQADGDGARADPFTVI